MEAPAEGLDYSAQRDMLANADLAARLQLAQAADTRPEILSFLAGDEAVAANPATPMQADEILMEDADDDVRGDLALKIARLLPDMPMKSRKRSANRSWSWTSACCWMTRPWSRRCCRAKMIL
jgi:hypothetical protein